jgi:hypothetical protein
MRSDVDPLVPVASLECPPGTGYTEAAFLYFMALEQARAQRASGALRLLLVSVEPSPGRRVPIPPATAARLFGALRLSMRDTDVVGWYRQDRIAGVLLSERGEAPRSEGWRAIEERVERALSKQLPAREIGSLRLRVVQVPAAFGSRRIGTA